MKILLISGHGAGDPGTVSQFGKEADETIYMVEEIKKTLSAYAQVDLYPTERNAYKDAKAGKLGLTSETMVMCWKYILIPGQQTLKETDGRQVRRFL